MGNECIESNSGVRVSIEASVDGIIGRGVKTVYLNDDGELIFLMSDRRKVNLGVMPTASVPVATESTLGGIKVGENLKVAGGVLSVDTADEVEQDNTKPITSAAVHVEVGNIEVLLKAL